MKSFILLISILISSCSFKSFIPQTPSIPKFYKGQKVKYKVDPFYSKVCSGIGYIDRYVKDVDGRIYYFLDIPYNERLSCTQNQMAFAEINLTPMKENK